MLLVSAGLLLRSLERLFAVDAGFDASQLLTMQVQAAGQRFDADAATYRFFAEALDAVRRVPGVDRGGAHQPVAAERRPRRVRRALRERRTTLEDVSSALRYAVTPGYLETMRIPLRRGRLLDARDVAGAPRAALISESLAQRLFRDRDPIGQRLRFGPDEGPPYTIVGVVGDVKQTSLALGERRRGLRHRAAMALGRTA